MLTRSRSLTRTDYFPIFANIQAKWIVGATYLVLVANWILAVARYQVNVLYWDQWGFFTAISEGGGWWTIFDRQHGPHREGIAFLITSWIMNLCRWDERVDSLWICSILFLSSILAALLKRRIFGPLKFGDAWIIMATLALGQYDTIITTPNASHSVFPLLLIFVLSHLWLSAENLWDFTCIGVCVGFLVFTGFGIFFGMVATGAMILCSAIQQIKGSKKTAAHLAYAATIAIAAWICFLINYHFDPAAPGFKFPWTPAYNYARFLILMVTAPAGWSGESFTHYAAGIFVIGFFAATIVSALKSWLLKPVIKAQSAVILLLALGTAAYCIDTAIGRIQMGPDAGLTSRYITLIVPGLFAIYIWSQPLSTVHRICVRAVLWTLVLIPYRDVATRPLSAWFGSLGSSKLSYERNCTISEAKLRFVMGYQITHDTAVVARDYSALVAPIEMLSYIDKRLAFQKVNDLSFFANSDYGYAPWLRPQSIQWLGAYPLEKDFRWIGKSAKLLIGSRRGVFLNLKVTGEAIALSKSANIEIGVDGYKADIDAATGAEGLSIWISPGEHIIALASPMGTVRAGADDDRQISFAIAEPTLTEASRFTPWIYSASDLHLHAGYTLTIESGFYGWENDGARGWMSKKLVMSAGNSIPAFLNIAISGKAPGLPGGRLRLTMDGEQIDLTMNKDTLVFSIALARQPSAHQISLEDLTGDIQLPSTLSSTDRRHLALSLSNISIDPYPRYPTVNLELSQQSR